MRHFLRRYEMSQYSIIEIRTYVVRTYAPIKMRNGQERVRHLDSQHTKTMIARPSSRQRPHRYRSSFIFLLVLTVSTFLPSTAFTTPTSSFVQSSTLKSVATSKRRRVSSLEMVQSLNTKALLSLGSIIRRPYLASPHVSVATISEVNYEAMREKCGIKAIIFDKDNTLTAPYENTIHPLASSGLESAIQTFGRSNVAILSNSAGTADDPGYKDATEIEKAMNIQVIRHDEKKPGGLKEVMDHFGTDVITEPSQLCMVGDRLLTDIVFGNLYGMLTVHTLPLCSGKENKKDNKIANVIRTVENKALYANWVGGRAVRKRTLEHKVWKGEEDCSLILVDVDDGDATEEKKGGEEN
mmetsp:Transcript_27072/g.40203  ORF Transcript_27072/g.40203 Transcript_27072/m.40203 type:complete len:354 (-) Transcript_27072:237-1298(-)